MHIGEPLPAFTKGDGKLNTVDTVSVRHGNNDFQNRSRLTADEFFAACERGSANALIPMLKFYNELSIRGPVTTERWVPSTSLSQFVARWVMPIDSTNSDPIHFIWLDHQYSWRKVASNLWINATNMMVKDHPSKTHAMLCAWEYAQAKYEQSPVFHEVQQSVCGKQRHYAKAIVPLFDKTGNVIKLLNFSQPLQC